MTSESTNPVRLHRELKAPVDRAYRAFLAPDALARRLPPYRFAGKVHTIDAQVGGSYRMSFTNFDTGQSHSFGGTDVELTPNERIRYTGTFDAPNLPRDMHGSCQTTHGIAANSWLSAKPTGNDLRQPLRQSRSRIIPSSTCLLRL